MKSAGRSKAARGAFAKWKTLDVAERAEYMRRLGRVMKKTGKNTLGSSRKKWVSRSDNP